MGAPFSPTIGKIFMSSVLRSFLHTQPIKPLTVARYIDDIFIIWTDTIDNLRVFQQIPPQPSIHTWINFLDLTIFKGPHFQYTNILDFRTFQSLSIPTLHLLSPKQSFQLSEVNVYAKLELTQLENLLFNAAHVQTKTAQTRLPCNIYRPCVPNNRQKYLHHCQKHQPICMPPLFKCLPPPRYKTPHNQPLTTACKHSHCITCRYHLLCTTTFQSINRMTYRIRHSLTCTSRNFIYLISCTKCKKQYVGCTTQQLNTRINHHRTNIINKISTRIATDFGQPGHVLNEHLKVQPIDSVTNSEHTIRELYRLECFWIRTLCTLTPHGLNNK